MSRGERIRYALRSWVIKYSVGGFLDSAQHAGHPAHMVMADWLEEHGGAPHTATAIRLHDHMLNGRDLSSRGFSLPAEGDPGWSKKDMFRARGDLQRRGVNAHVGHNGRIGLFVWRPSEPSPGYINHGELPRNTGYRGYAPEDPRRSYSIHLFDTKTFKPIASYETKDTDHLRNLAGEFHGMDSLHRWLDSDEGKTSRPQAIGDDVFRRLPDRDWDDSAGRFRPRSTFRPNRPVGRGGY